MEKEDVKLYNVQGFSTIKEMFELAVMQAGTKPAFKYFVGRDLKVASYRQFYLDTVHLGSALSKLGISGTHIACIGNNSYPWLCAYLTVLKSKGVFVPVDKELPEPDIINVICDSDSEVVFYDKKYEDIFKKNADKLPKVKYYIGFSQTENDGCYLSYDILMQQGQELYENGYKDYINETSDPNALKLLIYTSGTTGMSKGVELTEHNLVYSVICGLQVSRVYRTSLSILPYHHTYEAVSGILVSLHKHCCICINQSLKTVVKNLKLFRPDFIYVVPAFAELFYKKIWAAARADGKEKSLKLMIKVSNFLRKFGIDKRQKFFKSIHDSFGGKLRKIVCGGAPIRAELGQFFDDIGISLINGYGITECSPLVSANREECNDCTTVGIVLPCLQIKFINPTEDGDGEICVKGDVVMKGYYKHPELTREVMEDGWFKTGDYGKINKNGLLMITGRKKSLIVLNNGKNIFPEEIENYILNIDYVKEVIVYGIKNSKGMEDSLCAEIFPDYEALESMDDAAIIQKLQADISAVLAELPSYKRIAKIKLRKEDFEKTTTNKIKRNTVKHD